MTVTSVVPGLQRVFESGALERGIVHVLTEEYKISGVGKATCPGDRVVEPQTSFSCSVRVDGKLKSVKIVVKSIDGEYEVGQPV